MSISPTSTEDWGTRYFWKPNCSWYLSFTSLKDIENHLALLPYLSLSLDCFARLSLSLFILYSLSVLFHGNQFSHLIPTHSDPHLPVPQASLSELVDPALRLGMRVGLHRQCSSSEWKSGAWIRLWSLQIQVLPRLFHGGESQTAPTEDSGELHLPCCHVPLGHRPLPHHRPLLQERERKMIGAPVSPSSSGSFFSGEVLGFFLCESWCGLDLVL